MDPLNDSLTKWQPFFNTAASVTATLAGLLFVSLSLNRDKIAARENYAWLYLARRSFGDFLYALFISLMFLMPFAGRTYPLAFPLLYFSALRVIRLVRDIARSSKTGVKPFWDFAFQAVTGLALLVAAIQIYRGAVAAIYTMVPLVSFLLYFASLNAWRLLMMEKAVEERKEQGLPKVL